MPDFSSANYWEHRYSRGRNSGAGSYGRLADFKAAFLNEFVRLNQCRSQIDFGVGDGNLLSMLTIEDYLGLDVSRTVVEANRERFAGQPGRKFLQVDELDSRVRAELATSIDVIFHLVEDEVFSSYMRRLFEHASQYVVIYSSNFDRKPSDAHVRHHEFTAFVDANIPDFKLVRRVPNRYPWDKTNPDHTSFADFYVYSRRGIAEIPAIRDV